MPQSLLILTLTALAVAAAALLRICRTPGWPILGGLLVGLLLGPTIFGRVMPDQYERIVVGAASERAELHELLRRHEADRLAHDEIHADEDARAELAREHAELEQPLRQAVERAERRHQQPYRAFMLVVVAIVLLAAGLRRSDTTQPAPGWLAPATIGLWAAAIPGVLTFIAAHRWWAVSIYEAIFVAAAVAIGPWVLTAADRRAADSAEVGGARLVRTAGQVTSILAMSLAAWVLIERFGTNGWPVLVALAMLIIGWLMPAGRSSAMLAAVLNWLVLPALAAVAALKLDLISDFNIWAVLVVLILSGDGRWFGSLLGALLPGGRRALRTMALVLGSIAAGPTQLALLAVGLHYDIINGTLGLALLIGVAYIELSVPLRRTFAPQLLEAEAELDAAQNDQ